MRANRTTGHVWHCLGWVAMAVMILIGALSVSAQEQAIPKLSRDLRVTRLQLPDASGVVALDYFAYERRHARV